MPNDESQTRQPIRVSVAMPRPSTHYFEVTISVPSVGAEGVDLIMPVWTPGSYLVREFARNVQEFSARDESGGALRWEKVRKNVWRIHPARPGTVTVLYRVYGFEVSVRTSWLDETHAFINPATVFMYVDGRLDSPYLVQIDAPPEWDRISTGLEPAPDVPGALLAPDFDTLVDCPLEIGRQREYGFFLEGVPHIVSIYGEGNEDPERLCSDLQKISAEAASVTGEIPYRRYVFLLSLLPEGGAGLEHMNSTALHVNRWGFRPDANYRKVLNLAAHELFHAWNVKRIRPCSLGPFDYSNENYTRLLWFCEGLTEYYADQLMRRAGLVSPREYLDELSRTIKAVQETPGRLVESVADASFDAWIKFYRPDSHSQNATISYYSKGNLVGMILDLEIRHRNPGACLDDVMRLLYAEYYKNSQRGFTELELREAFERVAGGSLAGIFEDYIYGTRELDYERYLGYAGLKFQAPTPPEGGHRPGYLGIAVQTFEGHLTVVGIPAGSPAHAAGLSVNDEIVAVNGFRMSQELLPARIEEAGPGASLEFLVCRTGRMTRIEVVTGDKPLQDYKIVRIENAGEEQKTLYGRWLRSSWQEAQETERTPPADGRK